MARKTPEVNSSSTADMAFLLLCFFMMTTTMDQDKGLSRRLPPMPDPKNQMKDQEINSRNILQVKINAKNNVLAASKSESRSIPNVGGNMSVLGTFVKDFILNVSDRPDYSEGKDTVINEKRVRVSKGIVSLQNDRGTNYEKYIEVQNELVKAFNEIRNTRANQLFGMDYKDLDADRQDIIKDIVPQMISEAEPKDLTKK
jgi:biopolymer transport protein ExbD